MKIILYLFYAVIFYIYNIFPIDKNKTTFIMTHDESINGNIMCMYKKIKEEQPTHICKFITRGNSKSKNKIAKAIYLIKFIIETPYNLATSKYIYLDNIFLPMAFIRFRSEVKVVQLWHGCNSLKKFGQLSNKGILKWLEYKANKNYTHVIVSSDNTIKLHEEAFNVEKENIYPLGLPRTDIFFDKNKIEKLKDEFYIEYPHLINKKIILYAPTFRDDDLDITNQNMDLSEIIDNLAKEYIILTKFHPFVANRNIIIDTNKLNDVSNYKDISTLLLVADILITDYSSIIFEYALLNKPILFYAYDLEDYKNKIRGFYYIYEEFVPGKIVQTKGELVKELRDICKAEVNYDRFNKLSFKYKDYNSVDRIYKMIYKN